MGILDFVFVERAITNSRYENFPDTGGTQVPHRLEPSVPAVEIADDTDALRVRRPNSEARARNPIDRPKVRAELVVNAPLVPLPEQIQIRFAERRQERIRVAGLTPAPPMAGDHQVVSVHAAGLFGDAFKQAGAMDSFQLDFRLALFVHRNDFDRCRVGKERAHHDA